MHKMNLSIWSKHITLIVTVQHIRFLKLFKNLDIDVDDSEIVYLALHIYHFQSQNNTQNE